MYKEERKNLVKQKNNYKMTKYITNKIEKYNKKFFIQKSNIKTYEDIKIKKKYLYRPFVRNFSDHKDSVLCIKNHSKHPSLFFSGSSDGIVNFWLTNREKPIHSLKAHESFIRSLAVDFSGSILLSCSDDKFLKIWYISELQEKPKAYFENNNSFNTISTHPLNHFFISGGKEILLWDLNRFEPIQKLFWGLTSISKIEFNPYEYNLICACGSDQSIILCDLRINKPVKKILLNMRSNDVSWNLFNSSQFTTANEDSNLYSFDLRNLKKILKIYQGHVMPVLCVDHDPKTQSFASGSFDNTIRLYGNNIKLPNEIFFSKRMRRVLDLSYSIDGQYIISASEDGNLRLWKKFENNNSIYLNSFKKMVNIKKKNSRVDIKSRHNFNLIPKTIKNMIYMKNMARKNENVKKLRNSSTILPGYISFEPKK